MRRINILFALVLLAWVAGCAAAPPKPMANHCPIYGYEDLSRDNRACTTEPVVVPPMPGFTYPPGLRMTMVSGVPIQIWIEDNNDEFHFKSGGGVHNPLGEHPYAFVAIYRNRTLDVITITASDVCRIDRFQRYEGLGYFGDPECWYEAPDLGEPIDRNHVKALFPGVIDELVAMATRSGRNYIFSLARAYLEQAAETTTTKPVPAPGPTPGSNQL